MGRVAIVYFVWFLFFGDRVSLSSGWPQIHYGPKAGHELLVPSALTF